MKYRRLVSSCVFALAVAPSFASAEEPTLAARVHRRVDAELVKPLSSLEEHRFSRSRPPPRERRVRVLQTTPSLDRDGRPFMAFAIDVRFGADWQENDIVGCAYTPAGGIFVKRGDAYRPAAFLLGKDVGPVANVCTEARPRAS